MALICETPLNKYFVEILLILKDLSKIIEIRTVQNSGRYQPHVQGLSGIFGIYRYCPALPPLFLSTWLDRPILLLHEELVQLYVLLSRVRRSEDIVALVRPDRVSDEVAYARNIMYGELL
ncbi:hypothetical protein J6590_103494 [Homalodisca vitripennis]|nr:hypothetical protein J6590_103494 [Homalodisca vitripennis]